MKTSSRKAKGRALQNHVVAKVLTSFPSLEPADVRGAIMGENGEDIKLSPKAKKWFNFSVECKNQEKYKGVYDCFDQIEGHKDSSGQPLVILKMNRKKPLAIVDLDYFFTLIQEYTENE